MSDYQPEHDDDFVELEYEYELPSELDIRTDKTASQIRGPLQSTEQEAEDMPQDEEPLDE